jgi:aspartyl-tRNA(Asn)/glutamyl-tRNA(Gln) amidotransferase subunit C|tara:strand:- start:2116 stop:2397 length:282 start_codon:yes stop_codon:yes gene_type:complete
MDNKTIETISYLARLKLDKDKKEKITKDLENIINFVAELQDIDTKDIAPLANPLEKVAPKREDSVTSESRKEAFLSNSPESDKDYFMVPKVVE